MAVRLVLNIAGFDKLRTGPGATAVCRQAAERIAAAAGDGHEVRDLSGEHRARFGVVTATEEARRGEAERATLTRAIDAGRL